MTQRLTASVLFFFCFLLFTQKAAAQELQCVVNVSAPTLGSDKQVYEQLQDAIMKYINFRKWTDLKYQPQERIKCRMQILISGRPSVDQFKGTIQIQLIRPVYNSTYETIVINVQDKNFNFNYVPFQPLEFSENNYIDELTSVLNYYAYMLIAFDQESYQLSSGAPYFEKAQQIVSIAANNGGPGWRNFDGTQNRYWLVNDMRDNSLRQIHNIFYVYHRQGLDQMEKNIGLGRASVLAALKELDKLNQRYPAKYITRVFVTAKSSEILDMFKKATMNEKAKLIEIMEKLDPANGSDYADLRKAK